MLFITCAAQVVQKMLDGHIRDRIEPIKRNAVPLHQLVLEIGFDGAFLRRQKCSHGSKANASAIILPMVPSSLKAGKKTLRLLFLQTFDIKYIGSQGDKKKEAISAEARRSTSGPAYFPRPLTIFKNA